MRRTQRIFLAMAALGLMVAAAVGLSGASFTSQSANPANTFTAATNFCTDTSLHTVIADRDTYVDQNISGATGGTTTPMSVQTQNSSRNRRALVGFTVPTKPAACSVVSATLKLTATASDSGTRTLQAFQILPSATWSETAVTWNSQPATTGTAATTSSALGLRSWTVTSQVQAMYGSTNANNGFLIREQTEDTSGGKVETFSTREASSGKPVLEVTFG